LFRLIFLGGFGEAVLSSLGRQPNDIEMAQTTSNQQIQELDGEDSR
jgi:hypothetical protein